MFTGYGYGKSEINSHLSRRLTTLMLLQRFSNLKLQIRIPDWDAKVSCIEDLEQTEQYGHTGWHAASRNCGPSGDQHIGIFLDLVDKLSVSLPLECIARTSVLQNLLEPLGLT